MEIRENNDMDGEKEMKIYEVGYHIIPLIAEDNIPAEVGNIKGFIESKGGLFISEDFPKFRQLAYALSKSVDGHKHNFDQAYFGWVKFEIDPEALPDIKKFLDNDRNILRYLLIETVRENTMSFIKPSTFRKDGERAEEGHEEKEKEKVEITKEDEEKISKSIDELVGE
jgi:ribosomal protein S6